MNLSVQIGTLKLQNPVMVASGTFGYGVEYARLMDLNQLGAVVVKGIRLEPVRGNFTPRTVEVASGLINAIGLQGPGVEGFIKKYWPFLKGLKVPTIINIWGTTVGEYAEVAQRFDALGGVGALELNVSCPNIKEGGAQFGTDVKLLAQVVAACRKVTKLPLITKMSPNVVSIAPYAKAAEDAQEQDPDRSGQAPSDRRLLPTAPRRSVLAGALSGRPALGSEDRKRSESNGWRTPEKCWTSSPQRRVEAPPDPPSEPARSSKRRLDGSDSANDRRGCRRTERRPLDPVSREKSLDFI